MNYPRKPSPDSKKNNKNLMRFHGDAVATAVDEAAASYQSPSIIAAGANAGTVSLFATLANLFLSLLCIKAPRIIERLGKTKKGAVTLSFINLVAWVPLIIAFFLSPLGIQPVWFALLWLVNVMPGLLLTFQRDNWLSNIVPRQRLGGYLGQRLAIKSGFYLVAFCFLGWLLDSAGNGSLVNFAIVFTVALGVALVDFIIFTLMHDHKKQSEPSPEPEKQDIKFSLFSYIGELRAKKLDDFITFTSLFYLTIGLSGPLYAVYMLQEQHFSYLSYTIIIAAEYLARVISAPFWGRFADKEGNIRVLSIVSRIIPAIPICWLFCSNVGYLAVVQMVSGVCWGGFDLCTQNYIYKVAPQEKKLRYIVYTRCLVLFSTALGGLGGVYLIKGVFTIFGSQMLSIFLISGFFRAIVVMFLMPKLVDHAVNWERPVVSPEVSMDTKDKAQVKRNGLFYQRGEPIKAAKHQSTVKNTVVSSIKYPGATQRPNPAVDEKSRRIQMTTSSVLQRPQSAWAIPGGGTPLRRAIAQPVEVTINRRPWFRDPDIRNEYTERNRNQAIEEAEKRNREAPKREGIAHNSDIIASYKAGLQQQMTANLEKKNRETANREGIAHNSDAHVSYNENWKQKMAAKATKQNRETANREGFVHNPDVHDSYNENWKQKLIDEAAKKNRETANRDGFLHDTGVFDSYSANQQKKAELEMLKRNRETANREGFAHNPDVHASYNENWKQKLIAGAAKKNRETANRDGFLHDRDVHKAFQANHDKQIMLKMEKASRETPSREGLFYNNYGWNSYKKESLRSAFREKNQGKAPRKTAPVVNME